MRKKLKKDFSFDLLLKNFSIYPNKKRKESIKHEYLIEELKRNKNLKQSHITLNILLEIHCKRDEKWIFDIGQILPRPQRDIIGFLVSLK